jgi:hypothetical protein
MIALQKAVLFNAKNQSGEDAKFLREFPCKNLWKRLISAIRHQIFLKKLCDLATWRLHAPTCSG